MFFQCKNCGGNIVYNPEKQKMVCPFCESEGTEEKGEKSSYGMGICPNCHGEIPLEQFTSAMFCPYCNTSIIVDERVEGEYQPRRILPFKLGKEACKQLIKDRCKKVLFAPADVMSEARLDSIQGIYVPYWLYDYETEAYYEGEGSQIRKWRSGDMEYTEVSYYEIVRSMDIPYRLVPADASIKMPDDVMNLIEPYDYKEFVPFEERFMSGFNGEVYNMPSGEIKHRAEDKVKRSADGILESSYSGYANVRTIQKNINIHEQEASYGLLPVWVYDYSYRGKSYPFYVNGQTGKVVGKVPISLSKAFLYATTLFACLTVIITGISTLIF